MTTEEAVKALERAEDYAGIQCVNNCVHAYISPYLLKAIDFAITALKEREQLENPKPLTIEDLKQSEDRYIWCGEYFQGKKGYVVTSRGTFVFNIVDKNGVVRYLIENSSCCPSCNGNGCIKCCSYKFSFKITEVANKANIGSFTIIYKGCYCTCAHLPIGHKIEIKYCENTPREMKYLILGAIVSFAYHDL